MMKIAVITDDGETISAHFGRARHYLVMTVENGDVVKRDLRHKTGHHDFGEHHHDHHSDHEHEHAQHAGRDDPRGHGFGRGAGRRHASMIAAIQDCDVLLARGMGRGAYVALENADIIPITTDIKRIEDAVQAYLAGDLVHRPERLH